MGTSTKSANESKLTRPNSPKAPTKKGQAPNPATPTAEAEKYDDHTIATLLEPIIVANLLGANIPAVLGSKVYTASVEAEEAAGFGEVYLTRLGVFNTRAGAEKEIAHWVLNTWISTNKAPWGVDLILTIEEHSREKEAYLNSHNVHEIIDAHFSEKMEDRFYIYEDIILE